VRLVARFFDASAGSVLVGGVDVRHMSSEQLAGQISQIFQDSYLFQGSIADNIRLGKPGAADAEVLEAARQAGVAEIIARLPQGLDTPVGEGGARLSGGERQRIAIARALIKDAPTAGRRSDGRARRGKPGRHRRRWRGCAASAR
jgi:ATP-binding cassette subfamily B protein